MNNPQRDISSGRKALYYLGLTLIIAGFLLFGSVFFTAIAGFGSALPFDSFAAQMFSTSARGFMGILLIIAGSAMMRVGSHGVAGSGLLLDPRRTRQDLEPWGRAAGGLLSDAMDEAGLNIDRERAGGELPFDEKLRRLDQLHKENLITDEEYQAKRSEVLNQRW
jgi:hypothetical protein